MIDPWEGKVILWTAFVKACKVDTHAKDFRVFLRDQNWVSYPRGFCRYLLNKPASLSRSISDSMALRFGSEKRRKGCLIGLAIGSKFRWCSASSLGTPGMSAGHHAKITQRSQRNSTSVLSYALSMFVAIAVVFLGSFGRICTS